ncbi:maltooligosyltrehalose synthase [Bradyrhizobium sp. GM6.1]
MDERHHSRSLVDAKGLEAMDETWRQISNRPPRLAPYVKDAKRRVLETLLTSEFTVLTRLLARIANGHYSTRDFSADSLRQALELYVLHFPVYRTYLTTSAPTANDRKLIDNTIEHARREWFAADEGIFDFLRDALTMDLLKPGRPPHSAPRVRRFALKVQQFTGPMMAKSLEDTAFLSIPPAARPERSRRRSREQGPHHSRFPRDHAGPRQGMAARDDGDRHARHQTWRGRPRADCCLK